MWLRRCCATYPRPAPLPQPLQLHRHGNGPHGLLLGGGGVRGLGVSDHSLTDLLMAAPTRPRGEAADADRGHGAALDAAHRGHGIGKVSLQRV